MRDASSSRPRKVRSELTKTRQRKSATAASCWRACGGGFRVGDVIALSSSLNLKVEDGRPRPSGGMMGRRPSHRP